VETGGAPMFGVKARHAVLALILALAAASAVPVTASASVNTQTGTFADGATYLIEVPTPWNGTLLLYSHGYVVPGRSNPARDVGTWNQALDSQFALQQLLPGGTGLQIAHITNPGANLNNAEGLIATAQQTPAGRARLALASALGDLPGWFDPATVEPAATDFD